MLTGLSIRNFKRLSEADLKLADPMLLAGPNNSGKTSILQALALWHTGLRAWLDHEADASPALKRRGATLNRRDITAVPVLEANLLWHERRTRRTSIADGGQRTEHVRIEILVDGVGPRENWQCGIEFEYANDESLYCRPLRYGLTKTQGRMPIPDEAHDVEVAYVTPMSGLIDHEVRLDRGAIDVRIGQGRTAEVLRNLCSRVHDEKPARWDDTRGRIDELFGVEIEAPRYLVGRGEIVMRYRECGTWYELSSSGRGLQQALLLLAHAYLNEGAVLLLDEPVAHLAVPRQRQMFRVISEVAEETGSQIIASSHSELLINDPADGHTMAAFAAAH